IDTSLRLSDVESCAQFLMTGIDVDRDFCEFYVGTGIAPGGYVWIFPKGEDTANVGIGVLGSKSGKVRAMSLLKDFVKKHLPDGKITEIVVGGVPVRGTIERSVADGLMLVGDAAHQANPLTGGGIANAMDAGKIAGEVAAKAIGSGDVCAKALMEYEKRWRAVIGEEIRKALIVKNKFLKLNDSDFNRLAASLEGTNLEEMTVWGLLKALVRANPKLLLDLKDLV
ncbi:MAG TPA: NAD(P)/FAD-dependent oxidoreductase, partial [Candidatus Methanoperedenaceae archaeon]|nr:NAD(P)/FAD-dependent oxidoreductase [Candidatus Methanoperedenaceae archaeon]